MANERAKGTDRLMDILELFFAAEAPMTRNAIASALGMPRSTAYALVDQLVARGWLDQSNGNIILGHKSGLLGLAYGRNTHFEQAALELLQQLVAETGQAAELNIVDSWQQLVVLAVKGTEHSYLHPTGGERHPLPSTVSARVLLEGVPSGQLEAHIPPRHFVPGHPTPDIPTLNAQIEEATKAGFAVGHGLIDRHIGVIAVPVRDQDGAPIAAISMIMLSVEIDGKFDAVLPAAQRTALRLGETLRLMPWPLGERNRKALFAE